MKSVTPTVFLIGETRVVEDGLRDYLEYIGAPESMPCYRLSGSERLCEVYGRLCYRSFKPGLNPNVSKVREGNHAYLKHIIESGHGSVLEHATLNFIFADVSRVFTHELVRHRAGVAISQESLRYVRLDSLSAYTPICIEESAEGTTIFGKTFEHLEAVQRRLADEYDIENEEFFARKKELTSAFRRLAPMGLATTIGWSCNMRALRHVIERRTDEAAEEEIRFVFGEVYKIVAERYPNIFGDYVVRERGDGSKTMITHNAKI